MKVKVSRHAWGMYYRFWCPGCRENHVVTVCDDGSHPSWTFNGNPERPTFSPSIKVTGTRMITDDERSRIMRGELVEPEPRCCHSFVRDGRIEFLSDCTHHLAGKTVDLPDVEAPE